MSNEEKSGSGSASSLPFILFVLNCIIVANTTKDDFGLVIDGGEDFYSFHLTCMIASICMIVCILGLGWLAGVSAMSGNESCSRLTGILGGVMGLGLLVLVAVQYWKMGVIWDRHPHHTIMFYRDFWTDGLTHFGSVGRELVGCGKVSMASNVRRLAEFSGPHWPYVMSDVVARIYGFCMMLVPVILGIVACCGGTAVGCGRLFQM